MRKVFGSAFTETSHWKRSVLGETKFARLGLSRCGYQSRADVLKQRWRSPDGGCFNMTMREGEGHDVGFLDNAFELVAPHQCEERSSELNH
jgi:hypothetical protein